MSDLLKFLLKGLFSQNLKRDRTEKGFTLIELLVGTIVAFLIITPLFGFVIDLLNDDRRESAKTASDQEVQTAMNFISEDLNQAIHIYDATGINATLGAGNLDDGVPVLVFAKRTLIKDTGAVAPRTVPTGCSVSNPDSCDDKSTISFVAYYIRNDNNPVWCPGGSNCPARITRAELRGGDPFDNVPPANNIDFPENFNLSEPNTINIDALNDIPQTVLINFIDQTTGVLTPTLAQCTNTLGAPAQLVPANVQLSSFYACVNSEIKTAQVNIRGNALRRIDNNNANYSADKSAYFPTASTTVRGLSQQN